MVGNVLDMLKTYIYSQNISIQKIRERISNT